MKMRLLNRKELMYFKQFDYYQICEKIKNNSENSGIRIKNISKTYMVSSLGFKSKKDFQALKNIYLGIKRS